MEAVLGRGGRQIPLDELEQNLEEVAPPAGGGATVVKRILYDDSVTFAQNTDHQVVQETITDVAAGEEVLVRAWATIDTAADGADIQISLHRGASNGTIVPPVQSIHITASASHRTRIEADWIDDSGIEGSQQYTVTVRVSGGSATVALIGGGIELVRGQGVVTIISS